MPTQWFIQRGSSEIGPLSFDELAKRVGYGQVLKGTLVRSDHSEAWQGVESIFEFSYLARQGLIVDSKSADLEQACPPKSSSSAESQSSQAKFGIAADSKNKSASNESVPAKVQQAWFWLKGHDQTFVAVCVTVFLTLVTINWLRLSGWGAVPLEVDRHAARRYDFRIDINQASWIEWAQIEGIGEITARKIVADRDANGPFRGISDVQRVKGVGPKTLERIRPFLRVAENSETATGSKPSAARD